MATLFWDFDGTLVYNDSKWRDALHSAFASYNYAIDIEEIRQYLRKWYSWNMPHIAYPERSGPIWWQGLFAHIAAFCQQHGVTQADVQKINADFRQYILDPRHYTLYEDAIEALAACADAGHKNYMLSNNFPELGDIADALGLGRYFCGYVVSANIGYEKPRIELFKHALALAGPAQEYYMIGDNPIADIQGGKAAGMKTILVHGDAPCDADHVCANLSQIPPLLVQ